MAAADYRMCDMCGTKAFYDSDLDYQPVGYRMWDGETVKEDDCARMCGKEPSPFYQAKLQNLGDWAVICKECAKTHRCVIQRIDDADSQT